MARPRPAGLGALLLAAALAAPPLAAQPAQRALLLDALRADLAEIAGGFDGVLGVRVVDLTDGTTVGVNDTLVFPTASAIKVAILLELFRAAEERPGLLRERRPVTGEAQVGGTGISQHFADGASLLSLEDLAVLMIVLSDNTATNLLIDELGMETVNRTLAGLGLRETRLQRKMIRAEASLRGEENLSTPAESATLMARLARCDLPVSPAACERMREILAIPKPHPVRSAVPGGMCVAYKSGDLEGVAVAWAIVELPDRPYVISVMTSYGGADGAEAAGRASAAAYRYFSRLARVTPYGARVPLDVVSRAAPPAPAPR